MPYEKPITVADEEAVPAGMRKLDALERVQRELFFIDNPSVHKSVPDVEARIAAYIEAHQRESVWVVYPWLATAVRIPAEEVYFHLRTARNRNLITDDEQRRFRDGKVGIAGLSVGSAAFAALVATGGPRYMKIADPDTVDITNLNRMRATLADVGANKTDVAAREAWEIDPFLDLELWREGIQRDQLGRFLNVPRLDAFIDEMDSIDMKIAARIECRAAKIPVVMATDNGDSVILDVERFDLEPERPIFHGRVDITEESGRNLTRDQFVELANKIIDPAVFTPRQWESIQQVGKTLAGIPQIATAASIAGAAVAYAVRQILNGAPMPSGRYILGCDHSLQNPR